MTHLLFGELAGLRGKEFEDTTGFFSSEPLIQWILKRNFGELFTIESMIKGLREMKVQLRNKERLLQDSLDDNLEDEVINLRRRIESIQRSPKLDGRFKMISKFDIQSLRNAERTLDTLMGKCFIKEDRSGMIPEERAEAEREKGRRFREMIKKTQRKE